VINESHERRVPHPCHQCGFSRQPIPMPVVRECGHFDGDWAAVPPVGAAENRGGGADADALVEKIACI
jgi:hypothetical protein